MKIMCLDSSPIWPHHGGKNKMDYGISATIFNLPWVANLSRAANKSFLPRFSKKVSEQFFSFVWWAYNRIWSLAPKIWGRLHEPRCYLNELFIWISLIHSLISWVLFDANDVRDPFFRVFFYFFRPDDPWFMLHL